jgi:hypothetical protein
MREPPIEAGEWLTFAAARPELQIPDEIFGEAPGGKALKLSTVGFRWWMNHSSGMPVPVVLSIGAIHIGVGDPSAREYAEELAAHFNAYVQEG